MKHQIVVIHGADAFRTREECVEALKGAELDFDAIRFGKRGWKESLNRELGSDFEVIAPRMPNRDDARYTEWKVWFEKLLPFLEPEISLVGHSMGGIFIAKYLAENTLTQTIRGTFLVAPPFDEETSPEALVDFKLPQDISGVMVRGGSVFIYQSEDDPVVPFADFEKYRAAFPRAVCRVFTDRGHFRQETFPELVADIRDICAE
jgi:predicted alpha/beta hydrolase family esterase